MGEITTDNIQSKGCSGRGQRGDKAGEGGAHRHLGWAAIFTGTGRPAGQRRGKQTLAGACCIWDARGHQVVENLKERSGVEVYIQIVQDSGTLDREEAPVPSPQRANMETRVEGGTSEEERTQHSHEAGGNHENTGSWAPGEQAFQQEGKALP